MLRAVEVNNQRTPRAPLPACSNSRRCMVIGAALKISPSILPVELRSARTPCLQRLRTSSPQNPPAIHNLFPSPCGSRGKNAPSNPPRCPFSKSPELHSEDLENLHPCQTRSNREHGQPFHFSYVNYGYYCPFLLLINPFPPPRRAYLPREGRRAVELLPPKSIGH